MAKERLFLLDATAFCYRAFYAIGGLSTSSGQPTNAVYGFANMLKKIIKDRHPDFIAACFDVSRDTFRQKKFAAYKIHRPPMPEGLSSQMPFIRQLVSGYGIAVFEKEGYEADDIIATIAARAKEEGLKVTVVSSDKDILQLVDEDTEVFNPYKDNGITYDAEKVRGAFGVSPSQIPDLIALMGDEADNIPGISGVGEKTAKALIKEFGSLESVLAHANRIIPKKVSGAIEANMRTATLNKELAVLDSRVKLDFSLDMLRPGPLDTEGLLDLFKKLEFKKFSRELQVEAGDSVAKELPVGGDSDLEQIISRRLEVILGFSEDAGIFLSAAGRGFRLAAITAKAREMLSRSDIPKTGHDLKRIKVMLQKNGVILAGLYFDTMIAAYLINPGKGSYALEDLSWDYLSQTPLSRGIDNAGALTAIADLKPLLEAELKKRSLLELFRSIEMPLVEVLAEMETTGIKLNTMILEDLSKELERRLIILIQDIYKLSGAEFNINSPKQLRTIIFEKLGLPVVKRTKTGPSTDEEVLKALASSHELPALLLEYRQLTKLKNTYVDTLPALVDPKTGRIHTSFNQTGTETGRLSSSNPNLQNIPTRTDIGSRIRQAIVAFDSESYLLACDYSQIELRILAHISGDENLISEFRQDKDVHRATAALIYGLGETEVSDQMRDTAKRVNFGIIYGLTSYGLSRDLSISFDEAQDFIDTYLAKYPRVKDYMREQISRAEDDGFVTTISGRRRYIPEIKDKNQAVRQFAQRKAINTPIQGSASDLIKAAMIAIERNINGKGMASRMIMQVHDELVFNVPRREFDAAMGLIRSAMEHVIELSVPVKVTVKKGDNWLDMVSVN
ncbi:MAG: DNA polymerase I [Candidatus Omnitrophota bacterium]